MKKRDRPTDLLRLQYFFITEKRREKDLEAIVSILTKLSEVARGRPHAAVSSEELSEVILKSTNIHKSDLYKSRNDLARLGLVVPPEMYDERTYLVREGTLHSSGRASQWHITIKGFELVRSRYDLAQTAKIIATAYLSMNFIMNRWVTMLSYYRKEVDFSLAIKMLKEIVTSHMRFTENKEDVESLTVIYDSCNSKPLDIVKKTLKPVEILTRGDALKVDFKNKRIIIINLNKYIPVKEERIQTFLENYLIAIMKAYVSYLREKGLYKTIISQDSSSWPVPLLRIIERIDDKGLRDLELE